MVGKQALEAMARRVMVRVAMIDGELQLTEIDRIRWNVGRLTDCTPTEAQVQADVVEVQARAVPLRDLLVQARRELDTEGRRAVVRAAYIIASRRWPGARGGGAADPGDRPGPGHLAR